jgi:hemerythrin-like domain-containing protein
MGFITEFMNSDHEYLRTLWREFSLAGEDLVKKKQIFEKYKKHLLLHMKLEDEFLFARLGKYLGIDDQSNLTKSMDEDHKKIMKLLEMCEDAFLEGERDKIVLVGANLNFALKKHQKREMEIQYPVSDAFIKKDEWKKMLVEVFGDLLEKRK